MVPLKKTGRRLEKSEKDKRGWWQRQARNEAGKEEEAGKQMDEVDKQK